MKLTGQNRLHVENCSNGRNAKTAQIHVLCQLLAPSTTPTQLNQLAGRAFTCEVRGAPSRIRLTCASLGDPDIWMEKQLFLKQSHCLNGSTEGQYHLIATRCQYALGNLPGPWWQLRNARSCSSIYTNVSERKLDISAQMRRRRQTHKTLKIH